MGLASGVCRDVTLVYANRTEDDMIFKQWLDRLDHAFPNVHVYYLLKEPVSDLPLLLCVW